MSEEHCGRGGGHDCEERRESTSWSSLGCRGHRRACLASREACKVYYRQTHNVAWLLWPLAVGRVIRHVYTSNRTPFAVAAPLCQHDWWRPISRICPVRPSNKCDRPNNALATTRKQQPMRSRRQTTDCWNVATSAGAPTLSVSAHVRGAMNKRCVCSALRYSRVACRCFVAELSAAFVRGKKVAAAPRHEDHCQRGWLKRAARGCRGRAGVAVARCRVPWRDGCPTLEKCQTKGVERDHSRAEVRVPEPARVRSGAASGDKDGANRADSDTYAVGEPRFDGASREGAGGVSRTSASRRLHAA